MQCVLRHMQWHGRQSGKGEIIMLLKVMLCFVVIRVSLNIIISVLPE